MYILYKYLYMYILYKYFMYVCHTYTMTEGESQIHATLLCDLAAPLV